MNRNLYLQTMRESDREILNLALIRARDASGVIDKELVAVAICEFLQCIPASFAGITVPRETLARLVSEVVALERIEKELTKRNQNGSGAVVPPPQ